MTDSSIPLKTCSRNEQCLHPEGPTLPATPEYFMPHKGILYSQCHYCRRDAKRASHARNREHNNARTQKWIANNQEHRKEYDKIYYQENSEAIKARVAKWANDYPERKRAYAKEYYWRDPESQRAEKREYYYNNKTRAAVYNKQYRSTHREQHNRNNREWEKKHPEYMRAKASKRRAFKKASGENYTAQDVRVQYRSQKGKCWHCGKPVGKDYHIDHLVALARGGSNAANNIVISCAFCNLSKGSKTVAEWLGRLF